MRMAEPIVQWTAGVRREVLANGLTLLVQPDAAAPAVSVVTHVRAGFFDEPDRWTGISHVLEHMFFKGTARRGVGDIARETKAAGGYLNASTSYDRTSYFAVLPAASFRAAVDLQSDALRNAALDPDELRRELQVIIQEARRKLDSPAAVAHETLHEVMFDRHRIRRWRIGHEKDLAGLTRDDVAGYYGTRYLPSRVIVAVAGDVDPDAVLAELRHAYEDWPDQPAAVDPSPEEPPLREVRTRTLRGDVTRAELALGWRGVPSLHPDETPLDVAAAVLTAGRGSWLYRELREPGIVTSVSASHYAPTELGVFSINGELDPARLDRTLSGIGSAVQRLGAIGPEAEDLERAVTLLRSRWARRMESTEGRAAALAAAEAQGGYRLIDEEYARLQSITRDEVRAAAARYLTPNAASAVIYLPRDRGEDLTPDRLRARLGGKTESELPPAVAASVPSRRTAIVARPPGEETAGVRLVSLPGADVLLRPKRGAPLLTLGYYVPRTAPEPPELAGLAALAMRSAVRGAGGLDATALAYASERLGGTLAASTNSDWSGFGVSVLAEHMAPAATLLRLAAFEPQLAASEVAIERGLMLDEARQVADDMFRFPFQLALRAAFNDVGYGRPVAGLPETIERLNESLVRDWQRERFAGTRGTIVAVGDFDVEQAGDLLAGVFGDLPPRPRPTAPPAQLLAPVEADWQRVERREKAQSAFAMIFSGPGRRDPDYPAAEVFSAIASGLGGRLFEALRDRRSLAYSVLASPWGRRDAGAIVTYIATSPEREEEAREAMLEELGRFAEEVVSDTELEQGAAYLAGQAQVRRQSGAAVAGEILDAWLCGTGLDELVDPGAPYRKVTREEIRAMLARSLAGQRAEGVVRGGVRREA